MTKFISTFFYILFIALLLGIAGLVLGSMLPIPGNIEMKIVKSGSMEPAIPTGALVVVKPAESYRKGDIITFGEDTARDIPTTHRVIAAAGSGAGTTYTTKGDANEDQDTTQIVQRDIIGKVVFHLPYAGFVLDFARQPLGFALLIGIPAGLVILEELMAIFKEVRRTVRRRRGSDNDKPDEDTGVTETLRRVYARRRAMDEIFVPMFITPSIIQREWWLKNLRLHKDAYGTSTALVLALVFMSTLFAGASGGTIAYFQDIERSIGNIFRAGEWQEPADPQDIVINEFLPNPDDEANGLDFGDDNDSVVGSGEWVELYNNGAVPVDVAGWILADESGGLGNTQAIITGGNTVPASTIVPPHGWLVVYLMHQTLNNPNGDSIFLYTGTSTGNVLIDSYTWTDPHDFCENEPTPGSTNASSTPSAGSCQAQEASPPNKSFARIPDGTGAFVDPIPTPGAPNMPDPEPLPTPVMVEELTVPSPAEGEVLGETSVPVVEESPPELPPSPESEGSSSASGGGSPTQDSAPLVQEESPPAQDEPESELVPEEQASENEPSEESPPASQMIEIVSPSSGEQPAEQVVAAEPEPTPEPEPEPTPEPTPEPAPGQVTAE
ncbi:MAG: signal peptidase I [Patescibacteria group bacterium]